MITTAPPAPEEQDFVISSLSPSKAQKRLALGVVLVLFVAFFITAGFLSSIQLARIDAFVPAYAVAVFVIDLITATLLFAQFSILRSRALLVIASGYFFTALVLISWLLSFPGVFAPSGLLGAGPKSTNWLYIVWHAGFTMFVIAYALLKDADPAKRLWQGSAGAAILSSVAMTAAVVCVATFLVTAYDPLLPPLMLDTIRLPAWYYAAGSMMLLSVVALMVLWVRWRSVLDLWLMVVMCAYVVEVSFPRFSVGWYAGRIFGVIAGSVILFVLLYEITTLYARLVHAISAEHREREARLMTGDTISASIAHEVNQPLSAMTTHAAAGLRWLDRATPDLDEAKAAFKRIAVDGHRAGAVIGSIRAIFKKDVRPRTSLDINELIGEALGLVRGELQMHRVSVQAEPNENLPWVKGDRVQLQQVLLNLITNAIESMAASDRSRVLRVNSEVQSSSSVMVSVKDTGTGVDPKDVDRIFNPLFTTKSHGMGMGLSICRSIIEAHEGQLWVAPNAPHGTVFHFILPTDTAMSAGRHEEGDLATSRPPA